MSFSFLRIGGDSWDRIAEDSFGFPFPFSWGDVDLRNAQGGNPN